MNKVISKVNKNLKLNDHKQLGKEDSILLYFAKGKKLNRFQAEPLGDHCLHTTISDLQRKYPIKFDRQTIKVPNRFGALTSIKEYWLKDEHLRKAQLHFGLVTKI
jgi:hypothetical protein